MARCEVEPELDWSGALRCVHLKSSRNPAAKRNRVARAPRCIVRSRLSSVYCERLSLLWVRSGLVQCTRRCPLCAKSGHGDLRTPARCAEDHDSVGSPDDRVGPKSATTLCRKDWLFRVN